MWSGHLWGSSVYFPNTGAVHWAAEAIKRGGHEQRDTGSDASKDTSLAH